MRLSRDKITPEEFQKMNGAQFLEMLSKASGGREYLRDLTPKEIEQIGREFDTVKNTYAGDGQRIMQYFVDHRRMDPSLAEKMQSHPNMLDEAMMSITDRIEGWKTAVSENVALAQAALRGSPDGGIRNKQIEGEVDRAVRGGPTM